MSEANYHVSYPDVYRYWSPSCEPFAGGDSLLTAMRKGWSVDKTVYAEEFWLGGMRLVVILHFQIQRGDRVISMPVISNPAVRRLLYTENFEVRPISERQAQRRRQHDVDAAPEN